jgi:hypothetical protein
MPRPENKADLVKAANEQFEKMWKLINSMPDEVRNAEFTFGYRDKNIRDILIHLYEWHQLLLNWAEANRNGEAKPFLPAPYTWKTYPEMNIKLCEKHQSTSYAEAEKMLKDSHSKVIDLIASFSDKELFEKKHFTWTGTTSLGSYCVSATSSHYDWAMKELKMHIKSMRET